MSKLCSSVNFLLLFLICSIQVQTSLIASASNINNIQDIAPSSGNLSSNNSSTITQSLKINPTVISTEINTGSASNTSGRPSPRLDPNCATFDTSNTCITCSYRFFLNPSGICQQVSDQCNTWNSTSGACTSCYGGYRLYALAPLYLNASCIPEISNCASYTGLLCSACSSGYSLTNGTCIQNLVLIPDIPIQIYPIVKNCSTYDNGGINRKCTACASGYVLVSGSCYPQIANCNQYYSNRSCSVCNSGYTLSAAKDACNLELIILPLPVVNNCSTYDSGLYLRKCIACQPGYNLVSGQCNPSIANCDTFNSSGQCIVCQNGYIGFFGGCISTVNYCNQYNSNNVCTSCNSGYVLISGSCYSQVANCLFYSNTTGNCTTCVNGYIFISGSCYIQLSNCNQYNDNGGCSACNNGYVLISFQCHPQILNCLQYNSDSICTNCSSGYILLSRKCYPLISNCSQYNSSNGQCTVCNSGHILVNGFCPIQINPIPLGVANCSSYDSNSKCIACNPNLVLVTGSCIQQIANCNQYNQNLTCAVCNQRYILASGQCYIQIVNCNQYTINGACNTCGSGFIMISGQCYRQVANCTHYNVDGFCDTCISGYVAVSSNNCYPTINGCSQYDANGQCTACLLPLRLYQNACYYISVIPNCLNAAQSIVNNILTQTQCYQCTNAYYTINNGSACFAYPIEVLFQNVTIGDNAVSDNSTQVLFNQINQLQKLSLTSNPSFQCYNMSYITWSSTPLTCDIQTECSCNTKQIAIRTIGMSNQQVYYWTSEAISNWFNWPATNFYFYYTNPTLAGLNLFKATQFCDGTWSFQNNLNQYLSGNRLYSNTLGCAQKWRIIQTIQGDGYYIQNFWNNGWLAFNGCRWQLSYNFRTKVRVQFWQ